MPLLQFNLPPAAVRPRLPWAGPSLFFLVAIACATTSKSFWIDECVTAHVAMNASLVSAWREMVSMQFAEVQLPFYVAYIWCFEKIFGHSELALRLSGAPLFLAGMATLTQAIRNRHRNWWLVAIAFGLSPFAWYYLNEARLYALQLGISALVTAALFRLADSALEQQSSTRWLRVFLFSLVALSGVSMLGQLWAGGALLILLAITPRAQLVSWWRANRMAWLLAGVFLSLIGAYYLWSLTIGARATAVGKTNLQTVFFIAYEQLGFMGPGPGRNELRAGGAAAMKPHLAGLALYGTAVGGVFVSGLITLWQTYDRRKLLFIAACVAVPAMMILVAGVATHFRVLGRHFTPFAIVLFIILGIGLSGLWRKGWLARGLVGAFALVSLWSCLEIRLAPRHQKDNYREAARLARAALAEGQTVWWNADPMAAAYYGVATADAPKERTNQFEALFIANPETGFAVRWPAPAMVIASKADIYDATGTLADYLSTHGYWRQTNLMAFTVWHSAQ
jgi:uncharacterized membrane protein